MLLLGYLLALVIGLTLGMFGGGGSILTVPVFVYVMGYDPKLAIAMSLPVVGATSLVGAVGHWRAGTVHLRSALAFGVAAMVGAFAGARTSILLTGRAQLLTLGAVMLVAAALMRRDSLKKSPEPPAPSPESTLTRDSGLRGPGSRLLFFLVSLLIGALTGIVGIGGGFLIVPALVLIGRVPIHHAVGTSLVVITMNTLAGFAGQPRISNIPFGVVLGFSAIAIAGILAGTRFVRFVQPRTLKRGFATLLLIVAAVVIWESQAQF